jgi:hypothetical protein
MEKGKRNLVGSGGLLFLLEPALLGRGGLASGGLAFDLDLLALVGGQIASEVGLLGRLGWLRGGELLDVLFSVTSLEGGGLVCLELAEVKVLDGVGCGGLRISKNATDGYSRDIWVILKIVPR